MPEATGRVDTSVCPLCGRPNHCGRAEDPTGGKACWCREAVIPASLLKKVPENLRGKSCICPSCVALANREIQASPTPPPPGPGDFYYENGLMVFTAAYHLKRGSCCGNRCRHCPFDPSGVLGTRTVLR